MKLTDKGVSDQLVADMRTMLEGHLSEAPFDANSALKKQRIKGMQDKLENLRTQRKRADDSASQAREQGRDDAADGHEEKGDRINNNIRDLKAKIRDEMNEDNTNDKSDDGEGMDKVQPKANKKKFADRKDKDIDNDGDTDSSDEYLHKKRKAISKNINKEEVDGDEDEDEKSAMKKKEKQTLEGKLPPALQKAIDKKNGKDVEEGNLPPALQKAIDKKKGKDTDDDEEVEEGKIKYRGNIKDLKAMKEDFNVLINKYGFETVKKIINSVS